MKKHRLIVAFWVAALFTLPNLLFAQNYERNYATRAVSQGGGANLGAVADLPNITNANPHTSASIGIALGLAGYQEVLIDFNPSASSTNSYETMIPGDKPIVVKFSLPTNVFGIAGSIEVQAIKGLNRSGFPASWSYTNVGTAYSGGSLLSLLNGKGEVELTLTPGAEYQGVRVRLSVGVGVGAGLDVYHAFTYEETSTPKNFYKPFEALSGVTSNNLANIASVTNTVTNAQNVLDTTVSPSSFATMYSIASVGTSSYLKTVFETTSKPGDLLNVVLEPGGDIAGIDLLSINLLSGFSINLYDSLNKEVASYSTSNPISITLLSFSSNIIQFKVPIPVRYDRVELRNTGALTLLGNLKVYRVMRMIPPPVVSSTYTVNYGDQVTVSASTSNGDTVVYFSDNSYANPTTPTFTPTAADIGQTRYVYAAAVREGVYSELVAIPIEVKGMYVNSKVFLQGAFSSTENRHKDVTTAWASILLDNAASQPYNVAPFNYTATETVQNPATVFTSTAATTDIVDWVLLEVYNTNASVKKAALVREDGSIVDLDGISPVLIPGVDGDYYLKVYHRNHLAVRSATMLTFTGGSIVGADLTTSASIFDNTNVDNAPAVQIGTNYAMWGGDVNGNGAVHKYGVNNDYVLLLNHLSGNPAVPIDNTYHSADLNLDGSVNFIGTSSDNALLQAILGSNPFARIRAND